MFPLVSSLLLCLLGCLRTRAALQLEILALRHQVLVLRRSTGSRRLRLQTSDRLLWVWLSRLWSGWRSALLMVKPETVIAWHRRGFRLYWTWKSRARVGRSGMSEDVRDLIPRMSLANPLWGAPRIHGELIKLGIDLSQATVAKYMVRHRKPPSQNWRTFLENHVKQLVSIDFFHGADGVFMVSYLKAREFMHNLVIRRPQAGSYSQKAPEHFQFSAAFGIQKHFNLAMVGAKNCDDNAVFHVAVTWIFADLELDFRMTISTSRPKAFKKCIRRSTENPSRR